MHNLSLKQSFKKSFSLIGFLALLSTTQIVANDTINIDTTKVDNLLSEYNRLCDIPNIEDRDVLKSELDSKVNKDCSPQEKEMISSQLIEVQEKINNKDKERMILSHSDTNFITQ